MVKMSGVAVLISLRLVTPEDESLFNTWRDQDETHVTLGLEFSDLIAPGGSAYLISDESGPLIFMRVWKALRFGMQFDPSASYRTASVAHEVVCKMEEMARNEEASEIIIRPGGKATKFAEKLGFQEFYGKYKCGLQR